MARDVHRHGLQAVVYDLAPGVAMRSRQVLAQPAGPSARSGDRASIVRELRELGDPRRACLIATDDAWLRRLMASRPAVRDAYRSLLVPTDDVLEICLDRVRFAQWCRDEGIPTPRHWRVGLEARPPLLRGPYLIRVALPAPPRQHDALPQIVLAADDIELMRWLPRFEAAGCPVLVSEAMTDRPVTHYSVGFARRPGRFLGFVAERVRPHARPAADGSFLSLRDEPSMLDLARCVAERLEYFGIGEVEILHDRSTGHHHVVQVNARPWRQYAMAPASGHDLLKVVSGARARDYPRGRSTGIHWWDTPQDLLEIARHRPRGPLGVLRMAARMGRAMARANVYARLDWQDPGPAWHKARWNGPDGHDGV